MKIQISTDYAIRILQYLHLNKEQTHTAMSVAQAVGVTYPFFIKIANLLKKNGLLVSIQGRNGGYGLGRSADQISLYDVFVCVEGEMQINRCLSGEPCTKGTHKDCNLHRVFYDLQSKVISELSKQTIADVAG